MNHYKVIMLRESNTLPGVSVSLAPVLEQYLLSLVAVVKQHAHQRRTLFQGRKMGLPVISTPPGHLMCLLSPPSPRSSNHWPSLFSRAINQERIDFSSPRESADVDPSTVSFNSALWSVRPSHQPPTELRLVVKHIRHCDQQSPPHLLL